MRKPPCLCRWHRPGGAVTFERYTEKARRAIFFARYEASQLPTGFIETEHLLLGLMREDVLLRIKLTNLTALREELARAIQTRDEAIGTAVDLPLSDDAKHALTRAAEEAEQLQHPSIDSSHLVLGVFRMEGKAAEALAHQGVGYQAYREALAAAPDSSGGPQVVPASLQWEPSKESTPAREAAAPSLREPIARLDQLVDQASRQLSSPSENFAYRRLKRRPWTRKEALGHLIDWATTHHQWFARALTGPNLSASGYPEDTWVAVQRYTELSWMTQLGLWTSLNHLLIHLLSGIPEERLTTPCRIGIEAPRNLRDLIAGYIEHCEDIIAQMLALG